MTFSSFTAERGRFLLEINSRSFARCRLAFLGFCFIESPLKDTLSQCDVGVNDEFGKSVSRGFGDGETVSVSGDGVRSSVDERCRCRENLKQTLATDTDTVIWH